MTNPVRPTKERVRPVMDASMSGERYIFELARYTGADVPRWQFAPNRHLIALLEQLADVQDALRKQPSEPAPATNTSAQDIPMNLPAAKWPDIVAAIRNLYLCPRDGHLGCGEIALAAADEIERLRKQPSEPAAEYRIPFPLMDSIYETLKFYANLCSYQGERIGGVLKGCPRGPEPTPAQLITHAEDLLQRINREVLGRQSETKEGSDG